MKNKLIESLKLWIVPIIILLVLLLFFKPIVCFFPKWFTNIFYNIYSSNNSETSTLISSNPNLIGPIGDTFGGTLGPIIAILAAYLTFIAFWIQYRANVQQESYIKQQRFEDTFFRLLDHLKKIVDSMDIRDSKDLTKVKASGCESFRSMYSGFAHMVKDNKEIIFINQKYDVVQNHYKHDLHHYFRFLYHILKFIKQAEISEDQKFKYSSILRATLSAYELVLIFYNGFHNNGKTHFKPLLEEFSFLKNIDDTLIFNIEQKKEYEELAFASSKERLLLLKERKKRK